MREAGRTVAEVGAVVGLRGVLEGEVERSNEMTELTLKGEKYRIRRADPRNLIIERLQKPKDSSQPATRWETVGFYGKVEDLAHALVKFSVDVPEAQSLIELVKLLRQEVKNVETTIITELRRHQLDTTSSQRQGNRNTEPQSEGVKSVEGL